MKTIDLSVIRETKANQQAVKKAQQVATIHQIHNAAVMANMTPDDAA